MGRDREPTGEGAEVEDLVPADPEDGPLQAPPETDYEVLVETRREARTVLDHRISLLNDLDDKAMRTVRTAVLVLGLIFSAAGVTGSEGIQRLSSWPLRFATLGVCGLFLTIVYGIVTYSDSETQLGPGRAFRREARTECYSKRQWLNLLLEGYDEWIDVVERVNERNAARLNRVQFSLITSLLCLLAALAAASL
ncbi:MAG: hypothetical protein ABEJ30_04080 [Halorientalis sp.]